MNARTTPSSDRIRTVSALTTASVLVLGSKFLAALAPTDNTLEFDNILDLRSRRYPDASHHCWAYRVGRPEELSERSSDAGEPSGTAGRPILDALRGSRLENATCIISRYFGGTRLGTGGLVRAYADAANAVIEESQILEQTVVRVVRLDFDHERTGIVYRSLEEFGVHYQQETYDDRAHGFVEVPQSRVEPLRMRLFELALTGIDWAPAGLKII